MPADDNLVGEVPIPSSVGYFRAQLPVRESFGVELFIRPLIGRDHLDITFSGLPDTLKLRELISRAVVEPKLTPVEIDDLREPNALALGFALALASRGSSRLPMQFSCPANENCASQEVALDITELAASELAENQNGFEVEERMFRYLSLKEARRIEAIAEENELEAQREYVALASTGYQPGESIDRFDGVFEERLRHATNVFGETECSSCGAPFRFIIRPVDAINQSGLRGLLIEVETIARILRWSPDSILALPDPVRRFYNERALEIAEKDREQSQAANQRASSARRR
jgi:hypothetical protein